MVAYAGVAAAPSGQRRVSLADSRTLRGNGRERRGVLWHPAMPPSTSCIQLIDRQLSQVQLFLFVNLPFGQKGHAVSISPTKMDSIAPFCRVLHATVEAAFPSNSSWHVNHQSMVPEREQACGSLSKSTSSSFVAFSILKCCLEHESQLVNQ